MYTGIAEVECNGSSQPFFYFVNLNMEENDSMVGLFIPTLLTEGLNYLSRSDFVGNPDYVGHARELLTVSWDTTPLTAVRQTTKVL